MVNFYIADKDRMGNSCEGFSKINDIVIGYNCYMVNYNEEKDSIDYYYFSFLFLKKNKKLILEKIKDMISSNNRNIKDYLNVFDFAGAKYIIKDYDNKHVVYLHNREDNWGDVYGIL